MQMLPPIAAKDLVDAGGGRFIFVYSPSSKLRDLSASSDLLRATVISVGDLTDSQSLDFLRQTGCNDSRASDAHKLVDGHLPFLLQEPVSRYCRGALNIDELVAYFSSLMHKSFDSVDVILGCDSGCACSVACAIRNKQWSFVGLRRTIPLLMEKRLIRSSLAADSIVIDSHPIQCYVEQVCACNSSSKAVHVIPPCKKLLF